MSGVVFGCQRPFGRGSLSEQDISLKTDCNSEMVAKLRHFTSKQKRLDNQLNLELDKLEIFFSKGDLRECNRRAKLLAKILRKHADDQRLVLLPSLKRLINSLSKCGEGDWPDARGPESAESGIGCATESQERLQKAVLAMRSSVLGQLSVLQNLLDTEQKPMRKAAYALIRVGLQLDAELKCILEVSGVSP